MDKNKQMTVDDQIAYNNYKLTADKILQLLSQIREDPEASAKRWVWELLQNAKDVPNRFGKVSVEIELVSNDILKFRHNGDTFSTKNITGLVQQVSSKDSQNLEGQTGKFGTGFICTHLLSDIIDVEGIVTYMDVNRKFKIVLDRSGYRSEDLLPRIESTLEELRHIESSYEIVENYEENRTEQSFDTVFTYHLTTQEKQDSAIAGLEDLINTLPVTLVTQSKKIKQVRVINRLNNTNVVYTCESKKINDNIQLSNVQIDDITKTYLSYITNDVALTTEVKIIEDGYEIIKRADNQPVLYRDFPLIGSEKFYFPYTLNGFDFNPTERRNGLLLNSADHPNCITNRKIVDNAVEAVIKFNEWLISNNAKNRYLLASSRIPESPEKYSEKVAEPWIKELQYNWRKQLLDQNLVETNKGIDKLRNLSVPAFTNISSKTVNKAFFSLIEDNYIGRGVLPRFEYLNGWLDVVSPEYKTWEAKLKYDKDDFLTDLSDLGGLNSLSLKVGKTEDQTILWLNDVYKFLVEQNLLNDFDKYAIIPNQQGQFRLLRDLRSDHTARIPSILKDIYNSVNQNNATIQGVLMDARVDASVFGNTLQAFSLNEMVCKLNEYVKEGHIKTFIGNRYIEKATIVAYKLISLYPKSDNTTFLNKRKAIYEFSKDYREMDDYEEVDVCNEELWKETDIYWFNNSYKNISKELSIPRVSNNFFLNPKSDLDTLKWLDSYLKFYRENSYGDLIKDQSVFPNQMLQLNTLGSLRYDDNIPEEFKDLAIVAFNSPYNYDEYRRVLLHKSISGYEQQNPLKLDEVSRYIKKKFDDSNDDTKEKIARHAIAILKKVDLGEPEERKLYDFAKAISNMAFSEPKHVITYSGFSWDFAYRFYINLICNKIANSININGLRIISSSFTSYTDNEMIKWVDSFIEFLHSYKSKSYWPIITDKEKGIGIWINQNNCFCRFQDVRKDDGILEELKDIAASNRHINHDFRNILYTKESDCYKYLETEPMSLCEVGEYIDEKIKSYEGNKQDNDFRSLVFSISKLCNKDIELEKIMKNFKDNKNSLIVWSLGEGTTMDLVGAIVQQGDEKLKVVKDILDSHSIEDLKNIKEVLSTQSSEVKNLQDENEALKRQIAELNSKKQNASKNDVPVSIKEEAWVDTSISEESKKKVTENITAETANKIVPLNKVAETYDDEQLEFLVNDKEAFNVMYENYIASSGTSQVRKIISLIGELIYKHYLDENDKEYEYVTCNESKEYNFYNKKDGVYTIVCTTLYGFDDDYAPFYIRKAQTIFMQKHPNEEYHIVRISLNDMGLAGSYAWARDTYGKTTNPFESEDLKDECQAIADNYWNDGASADDFDEKSWEFGLRIENKKRKEFL